jgi:hypothetical protein
MEEKHLVSNRTFKFTWLENKSKCINKNKNNNKYLFFRNSDIFGGLYFNNIFRRFSFNKELMVFNCFEHFLLWICKQSIVDFLDFLKNLRPSKIIRTLQVQFSMSVENVVNKSMKHKFELILKLNFRMIFFFFSLTRNKYDKYGAYQKKTHFVLFVPIGFQFLVN